MSTGVEAIDKQLSSHVGDVPAQNALGAKCFIEFLGTGLLAFTVACAAGQGAMLAGFAIGSTLMCAIYFGGHISGANYNPAVSLALLVRGALKPIDFGAYVISQIFGALIGGVLSLPIVHGIPIRDANNTAIGTHNIGHPAMNSEFGVFGAFVAEVVITFALCHVVINTATTSFAAGKSYYGLAIGFTVVAGALSVGGVSGGAFNPAVSMLTLISGVGSSYSSLWLYWVGPLLGGALAGALFKVTHPMECVDGDTKPDKPPFTDYVIEFIGTFLLSFTVATAASPATPSQLAPIAIGSMLMVNVYAGGPTSGGHFNPAVTIAVYLRSTVFGKQEGLPPAKAGMYIATQFIAALLAGFVGRIVVEDIGFPVPNTGMGFFQVWIIELVSTFFLAFVVLQTATAPANDGNSFFGLAIGFTVTAMAIATGAGAGGALNPAVAMLAIGAAFNTTTAAVNWGATFGVYCTACPAGGALAAAIYRLTNYKEFDASVNEQTPLTEKLDPQP